MLRLGAGRTADRPGPSQRLRVSTPAGDVAPRGAPRQRALAALCVTEIVSYGVLYFAFPVLAGDISAGTGWSCTAVMAACSAGNLTGAMTGVLAGRLIHHLDAESVSGQAVQDEGSQPPGLPDQVVGGEPAPTHLVADVRLQQGVIGDHASDAGVNAFVIKAGGFSPAVLAEPSGELAGPADCA